ncbi:cysteine desulfurase family protein [Streptomyces olindensis]|uniref:cysteine desulfurase family protein n=1 Tax=Streptomyces olindensis TaxID=358823 RepID=UPI003655C90C
MPRARREGPGKRPYAAPGLAGGPVYLDYNATTPVDPRVAEAMWPHVTDFFGNPSSSHSFSQEPRRALVEARAQVTGLIGARTREIVFTGSGSEADLLALRGAVLASGRPHPHVITQATEHPAVLETCRALERLHGARLTVLPVDGDGLVEPAALAAAFTEDTVLVSVMAANNETGALQPVTELAALAHEQGALFHCDAAQAVGKIPLDVGELGVDLLTIVGHKMYAPKGAAALYVRDGVRLKPVGLQRRAGARPARGRRTSPCPSHSAPPHSSRPPNSPTVLGPRAGAVLSAAPPPIRRVNHETSPKGSSRSPDARSSTRGARRK